MSGQDRRVSWLIPVRDGGTWLVEAVGSALADSGADDEVLAGRKAVIAALSLYLNFINLFMMMLRLAGGRR